MELEAIFNIPKLRYLAQDETRIGRKTQTKRVVTAPGVKPLAQVEWPREAFWLYGVVEPFQGWHFSQEYSQPESENFQQFLNTLSEQLGNTVAVMQLDRASAHRSSDLEWPENIIPIFQPSHCPELNPRRAFLAISQRFVEGREFCGFGCFTPASHP
jgi:hypothetical protein